MSEHVIKTIHKIRIAGKHAEIWFQEDLESIESYHTEIERFCILEGFHACMKTYQLLNLLEGEGIYSDVLTSGLKHRKTAWKRSKHDTHWEFVSFLGETRIVLIEKIKCLI